MTRLVVMMYVRFPLSLWNVEDWLIERGIEISHETVPIAEGLAGNVRSFNIIARERRSRRKNAAAEGLMTREEFER
ncbi:hypothetical protein [Sphingomonas immobilis]|uniref:Uncharacterized protein n=1 Tax=Sphingomonas immobilis TaxID=3063997 RepID=A0ABT8ZW84_9SPHN|nr:hypothetical protein [Sphingomonas sp. CA1-15]MDO7841842.1 hypothetical protein [Sphingomonas sp. CA1-15]